MNSDRYNIRPIDSEPEWFESGISSKVAPFPVRKWKEPLPIAVEGRPLESEKESKEEGKDITRFYPPLLILSTLLTAVFFFLYVTKPVVVEPVATKESSGTEAGGSPAIEPAPVDELIPWPAEESRDSVGSEERSSLAESSFFPEQLPSSSVASSKEADSREGILIPLFEVKASQVFTDKHEIEAELIQQELAKKRLEAEALQLQIRDLQKQYQSLLDSAEREQSTVHKEN